MPSFILIRPTVWPQCTNVTDRQTEQDRRNNGAIAYGKSFYKRSPKNISSQLKRVATLPREILMSEKQCQPEACVMVNDTSQGSVAT